jgi:hypothetical protein
MATRSRREHDFSMSNACTVGARHLWQSATCRYGYGEDDLRRLNIATMSMSVARSPQASNTTAICASAQAIMATLSAMTLPLRNAAKVNPWAMRTMTNARPITSDLSLRTTCPHKTRKTWANRDSKLDRLPRFVWTICTRIE